MFQSPSSVSLLLGCCFRSSLMKLSIDQNGWPFDFRYFRDSHHQQNKSSGSQVRNGRCETSSVGSPKRCLLPPVDHSDCLGGSDVFQDKVARETLQQRGSVSLLLVFLAPPCFVELWCSGLPRGKQERSAAPPAIQSLVAHPSLSTSRKNAHGISLS